MSDLYSRQISFAYERDSLLRRFPVPRGEIQEVEFQLPFIVTGVRIDRDRHQSRNAAIGGIFDDYSLRIVRAGLLPVQEAFQAMTKDLPQEQNPKRAVADRFNTHILSDDYRTTLYGRLLRYLNEHAEELLSKKDVGPFDTPTAMSVVKRVMSEVGNEPDVVAFRTQFGSLDDAFSQAEKGIESEIKQMADATSQALNKYPDYAVDVDIDPNVLKDNAALSSYIKVKAVVKNYHWSKTDVDSKDMRNLRTLVAE
jgi:hypothetical protein